jgi:SEC-C motif domain protein
MLNNFVTAWNVLLATFVLSSKSIHSSSALAGNARKIRQGAAKANKGFGANPDAVYRELVSTFRTRIPVHKDEQESCPCGSSLAYENCCGPYHNATKAATSPTALLRSRYTAFAYRIVPYIIDTTHPLCRDWRDSRISWAKDLNRAGMFDSYEFCALFDISPEETSANEDEVFVDFKVRLKDGSGQATVISERSRFLRNDKGAWLYASGEVRSNVEGLQDVILNP